ncbi:sigma-70 family RNA polymerase sigma factor [Eubacterium sp. 14-2]|uniref:RNA polymerase sigma factor n=1 Tax=Eubacterium sp. 14-2 TaxID=1235790 RepID=UPI00033A070C|nr:sigma-70 family RNA polymerase sigma factor [Eubacterium sp. 14-2]EOT24639.1 sigma-70 family RNA polymerase sigma factor [Eubacterium sp. 14-2]
MNNMQLEQCIREYGKNVYAFCSQLTGNKQEAEELYQDTFLKAVELKEKMDRERNPGSYLISIALRIWKNKKRKYAWRNRIAGTEVFTEEMAGGESGRQEDSTEETFFRKEQQRQVREAVAKLEEKYRIPVYLYYSQQFTTEQIGKVLKLPQGTVKSRLYKARKLLKKELEVILDER